MSDPVSEVESKLGDPYQWGGTGPNAFDCSGLMQWAYGQVGIKLPRTSQEQRNAGRAVDLTQAQPGDLLTYSYPGESGNPTPGNHVGMYLSPGRMIDAPYTGADVRVDPIDTAHLDRVVHVTGSPVASTSSADTLASFGINPETWPGTVMNASWNPLGALGDAASGVAASVTSTILKAVGPLMLNAASLAVGGGLIVMGLWRMTEPARTETKKAVTEAGKVAAVAAI